MVCFHTKIPILRYFGRPLNRILIYFLPFGIFYGPLVYFGAISSVYFGVISVYFRVIRVHFGVISVYFRVIFVYFRVIRVYFGVISVNFRAVLVHFSPFWKKIWQPCALFEANRTREGALP
jgi:hypothetical protein